MRVPLLDLSQQYQSLAQPIRAEIDDVLSSQRFILGPKLKEFEQAIAEFCQAPFAIGVSSGTDALLAFLMGMGVGPGQAVITTAYTFFATAGCVSRLGAKPVFVDIDPVTLNISPAALQKFLTEQCEKKDRSIVIRKTGETLRGLIPVHLFGLCCEMNDIYRIAEEFGLTIIEDAAQAIGAQYPFLDGTRAAGTMGAAGFLSFYPTKNLGAAGDAGLILCRDHNVAERLRCIRQHGMEPRYYHSLVGGNFRLDEIQAAVLKVKLPHLPEWAAARRAAADFYRQQMIENGLTDFVTLPAEPYRDRVTEHHVYHQFVIRTPNRDALRDHLTKHEIGSEIYYPVALHLQECFRDLGYKEGDLPETERATREALALPIYPEISRDAQEYVVATIGSFFAAQRHASR
jgi:dTDP-4-amino-4,6-dideoxygalactose transaminase